MCGTSILDDILESGDGDVVEELVGALQTMDSVSIEKSEHSDEDAVGDPHEFTLLVTSIFFEANKNALCFFSLLFLPP